MKAGETQFPLAEDRRERETLHTTNLSVLADPEN